MLRPSYTELMNILNEDSDLDNKITSRYSIVIAVAKRARQIIDGATVFSDVSPDKAVSAAVSEMNRKRIKTFSDINNIPEAYRPIFEAPAPRENPAKEDVRRKERSSQRTGFDISANELDSLLIAEEDQKLELDDNPDFKLNFADLAHERIFGDDIAEMDDFDEPDDLDDDESDDLTDDLKNDLADNLPDDLTDDLTDNLPDNLPDDLSGNLSDDPIED